MGAAERVGYAFIVGINLSLAAGAALLASMPAAAAQVQSRIAFPGPSAPVRIGLPWRPAPVLSIGAPAIRLPSPSMPIVAVSPRIDPVTPITMPPVIVPPRGIERIVIAEVGVELPAIQPASPKRLPGAAGAAAPKVDLKGLDIALASIQLGALFDNSGTKDPAPVVTPAKSPEPSQPLPAPSRPYRRERPITLPESDLEDEIGISPLLDPR